MQTTRKRLGVVLGILGAVTALGATQLGAQTLEVPVPPMTPGGSLTITPPTGTQTATVANNTATITLPYSQVADSRTLNGNPSNTGWTATVSVTSPLTKAGGATIAADKMTWTTGTRQKNTVGVWAGTAEFSGGSGTMDNPVVAAQATTGVGHGTFRYNATVTVDITDAAQGTYTGTIEQTVS